jgi:hypothetical protein
MAGLAPFFDDDRNGMPDTCERDIPDPCPHAPVVAEPKKSKGPKVGNIGVADNFGGTGPVKADEGASGPTPQKEIPRTSCQMVKAL